MFFYNTKWQDFKKVYKNYMDIEVMFVSGYCLKEMLYFLPNIKIIITDLKSLRSIEDEKDYKPNPKIKQDKIIIKNKTLYRFR